MKLSNLSGVVLTFADDFYIGDIPINEDTRYYGHILQDGDQTIFTFSGVSAQFLVNYISGVSARIYVKNLGGKKFKISGVLFNLRNAYVWDRSYRTYVDIGDEQEVKRSLAQSLAGGTLKASRPKEITNVFSYIKGKLNELVLEKIPNRDPEPSEKDLKAQEELRRNYELEKKDRDIIRQEGENDVLRRKQQAQEGEDKKFDKSNGFWS